MADAPLTGRLKLGPYRLQKVTPRPDVGTLNSTIDGLNRAGDPLQQFDALEAKVVKTGDRIELKDGRTAASRSASRPQGVIDLASDTAHLRGIVVPGFALNNLLSNVPLLGPAADRRQGRRRVRDLLPACDGPLDDLKTDVNMMSAMTPGALRELFNAHARYAGRRQLRISAESDRAP